jgi:hypothetical protein
MPHDPARVAETKSWFEKAANDLRAADHEITAVPPLTSLETLLRRAERLSVYAWAFRYPGDAENPSVEEAQGALAVAREVVEAMLARLPAEIRS